MSGPRTTGSRAKALLAPQILLGAALALCPDTRLPLVTQALTGLHVASAVASVLALAVRVARHARGRAFRSPSTQRARPAGATLVSLTLAACTIAAYATGALAAWGGQGTRYGDWHAIAGLAIAMPLAVHLIVDAGGTARGMAWLYLLIAPLAIASVRAAVRPSPAAAPAIAFASVTRDPALYDSAEWCGSCHVANFQEWIHSTHARSLSLATVRRQFRREIDGGNGTRVDSELTAASVGQHCVQCHAPGTFYGSDPAPVLDDKALEEQGIACGFCHTLRALDPSGLYVSAPQTIRRYIGQGSSWALPRAIGDLLIRWRPEQHRRDYHVPWLGRSAACAGCHLESFESWRDSPYAGTVVANRRPTADEGAPDPPDAVSCQDCHMAREPRVRHVVEPDRLVPWGKVRPERHQHSWRGGNARASIQFDDDTGVELDRGLRRGMIALNVSDVRRESPNIRVTVTLRNDHVGHHYPSGEGGDARSQWLQLETLDEGGHLLDVTEVPAPGDAKFDQRERPGYGIALIHQRGMTGEAAAQDTRVPPKQERAYHLALPNRPDIARIRASVRSTFDTIAVATADVSP